MPRGRPDRAAGRGGWAGVVRDGRFPGCAWPLVGGSPLKLGERIAPGYVAADAAGAVAAARIRPIPPRPEEAPIHPSVLVEPPGRQAENRPGILSGPLRAVT